jgi:hypothetical protein
LSERTAQGEQATEPATEPIVDFARDTSKLRVERRIFSDVNVRGSSNIDQEIASPVKSLS